MCQQLKTFGRLVTQCRRFAYSRVDTVDQTAKVINSGPKPFESIPGPRSLPVIGTLYKYLPFIGEYSFRKLHENGAKKLAQYGPLVREELAPGVNIVWVFRPDDIAEIFKAEAGLHPERRSHLALLKYRKDRSHIYKTGGLLPTNGPEWWRLRREFQKVLSKPRSVLDYLEDTDLVVREFIQLCEQDRFDDFSSILSRLFLELTCLVAFDVRLHSLSKEEMYEDSRTSKLIDAAFTTNSAVLELDNGPRLWRFFNTPLYKRMCKAQNYMEGVAIELVSRRSRDTTIRRKESLLDAYFKNPALDTKDIVGMACDLLLAGVDTTTHSTSFALYHLARHPDVRKRLRSEAATLLKNPDDPITADTLRNATYTKAVIKESLRLNPISVGIGRILQTDVVLSGYHVPKKTVVVTQNQVICRLPEYFDKPNVFIPERWLRESAADANSISTKSLHPHVFLPFGHGPRSCIARRFAEQNMQVTLLRMCRHFDFEWQGGVLEPVSYLINKPNGPVALKLHRNSVNTNVKMSEDKTSVLPND